MSAAEALKTARAAGIRVWIDGVDLVLEASARPACAVLDLLSRHKADIVTLLQGQGGQGQEGQVPVRWRERPSGRFGFLRCFTLRL
jgi:hypothetical protein